MVATTPRTVSRSISCSGLKVRSNMSCSPLVVLVVLVVRRLRRYCGRSVVWPGQGRHRSPERDHGLSSAATGRATRAVQVVLASPSTDTAMSRATHPHPVSSTPVSVDRAPEHHGVAREDRSEHPERHPPQAAVRTGPVGDVALEPRRQVGGVEEDVLGAVAVDGEVLVVVHRPPVAGGQGPEHDGGGRDRVGQLGQLVADRHVARGAASGRSRAPPRLPARR